MKSKVLALLIPALLAAGAAHAAEVYNKDGNKLDLYGKVDGLHYFSDDASKDGDQTYMRLGFKGETQITNMMATRAMRVWVLKAKPKLTINSLATVNGNTIFRQTTLNLQKTSHGPVWHLPG